MLGYDVDSSQGDMYEEYIWVHVHSDEGSFTVPLLDVQYVYISVIELYALFTY